MHNLRFERPVAVSVGFDSKIVIRNLMDMHRFLVDWAPSRRTSFYSAAARACEAARQGHLTAEQAKRSFTEFAKAHDILWPDTEAAIAGEVVFPTTEFASMSR